MDSLKKRMYVQKIYSGEGNEQQLGLPYNYFLALLEHLNILAPAKDIGNKDFDYLLRIS